MLFLSEPSEQRINRFLEHASSLEFSYSELGATNSAVLPPWFTVDRNRAQIGSGPLAWERAVNAVKNWEMLNIPWVRLCWPTAPIAEGSDVAVLAHHMGCFWLNACRIVYVIDQDGTDAASLRLLAFSRPNQFLSRIGYPLARRLQKQFATDSKAAMARAVAG